MPAPHARAIMARQRRAAKPTRARQGMMIAALLLLQLLGSSSSSSASLPSQLAQLGSLLRDGTLTPAEFASAKQTLLRAAAAAADAATAPGLSSAPIPLPLNTRIYM